MHTNSFLPSEVVKQNMLRANRQKWLRSSLTSRVANKLDIDANDYRLHFCPGTCYLLRLQQVM